MATYTKNLNLKKPHQDDYHTINDFNANMDIIDNYISNGVIEGNNSSSSNNGEGNCSCSNTDEELKDLEFKVETLEFKVEEKLSNSNFAL